MDKDSKHRPDDGPSRPLAAQGSGQLEADNRSNGNAAISPVLPSVPPAPPPVPVSNPPGRLSVTWSGSHDSSRDAHEALSGLLLAGATPGLRALASNAQLSRLRLVLASLSALLVPFTLFLEALRGMAVRIGCLSSTTPPAPPASNNVAARSGGDRATGPNHPEISELPAVVSATAAAATAGAD